MVKKSLLYISSLVRYFSIIPGVIPSFAWDYLNGEVWFPVLCDNLRHPGRLFKVKKSQGAIFFTHNSRPTPRDNSIKQSYCDLCEKCPIDLPDFLKAISEVREYFNQLPINWWTHCFPGDEGFYFPEFRKGLEWFLNHPECLGCKGGGSLKECSVRHCVIMRQVAHCSECHDLETCEYYDIVTKESPGKTDCLNRYLLTNKLYDF